MRGAQRSIVDSGGAKTLMVHTLRIEVARFLTLLEERREERAALKAASAAASAAVAAAQAHSAVDGKKASAAAADAAAAYAAAVAAPTPDCPLLRDAGPEATMAYIPMPVVNQLGRKANIIRPGGDTRDPRAKAQRYHLGHQIAVKPILMGVMWKRVVIQIKT